jgi:hypothetical protein
MKRLFRGVILPITLLALTLTFTSGYTSCSAASEHASPEQRDSLRTFAKSSDDLAGGIKLTISTKRALAKEGVITHDEELTMTNLLVEVNSAGSEYNRVLTSVTSDTSGNRTKLLNALDGVAKSVDRLDAEGVTHIKNEAARQRAGLTVTALRTAIAGIRLTLTTAPSPAPPANNIPPSVARLPELRSRDA